jgi:hypothetical protein
MTFVRQLRCIAVVSVLGFSLPGSMHVSNANELSGPRAPIQLARLSSSACAKKCAQILQNCLRDQKATQDNLHCDLNHRACLSSDSWQCE